MLQVFQDFASYLKSSERSPLTVKNYLADLGHFEKWFLATNDYPEFKPTDITPTDLREFKQFLLRQQEGKPAGVNRRLAALRSFLTWASATGRAAPLSPTTIPKFEKTPPTGIRWLTRQEENALLRAVARYGTPRDQALITLLLHTGLRVSELCAVRWQEVVINERKGSLTVLCGKGGTRRDLPLNYTARQVLLALGYQAQAGQKGAVFVGQRGPLTPRGGRLNPGLAP